MESCPKYAWLCIYFENIYAHVFTQMFQGCCIIQLIVSKWWEKYSSSLINF